MKAGGGGGGAIRGSDWEHYIKETTKTTTQLENSASKLHMGLYVSLLLLSLSPLIPRFCSVTRPPSASLVLCVSLHPVCVSLHQPVRVRVRLCSQTGGIRFEHWHLHGGEPRPTARSAQLHTDTRMHAQQRKCFQLPNLEKKNLDLQQAIISHFSRYNSEVGKHTKLAIKKPSTCVYKPWMSPLIFA